MKISEAQSRITRHRIFAAGVMITAMLLLAFAGLKSISFAVEGDQTALASLSQALQRLVYLIYERTQFALWFWEWSPVINPKELNTTGNWGFLFVVVCGAIGRTMWDSASNLSMRIKKTIQRVEELGWEQELMGQRGPFSIAKPDVLQINIELDQKDQWYKQPIGILLLGVAIAILGQWLNLQFGLVKL
jgi:hypothetical protein